MEDISSVDARVIFDPGQLSVHLSHAGRVAVSCCHIPNTVLFSLLLCPSISYAQSSVVQSSSFMVGATTVFTVCSDLYKNIIVPIKCNT